MLNTKISRRVFIGSSAFVITASLFACAENKSTGVMKISEKGQFFDAKQLTVLHDIAEIMIPKTDTPGATDAHVIPVLDALMLTWASEDTKQKYINIIQQVEQLALDTYKAAYLDSLPSERKTLLTELDKQAFANEASALSQNYRKLKEMIFHVYYTSEEANPDFVLIPGEYKGCLSKAEYEQMLDKRLGRAS
jgi:hypothetical protein